MDDLISREMAIGVVGRGCGMCIQGILDIPAAEPEIEERKEESAQNVSKEDLISRKAAIDAVNVWLLLNSFNRTMSNAISIQDVLQKLPAAELGVDEWCDDCAEYDSKRHCCPRWNRVIRETLKDAQREVVRCRDCKWYNGRERTCNDLMGFGRYWKPDDFCSYGKRRTDDLQ